jgi:soluble cytochrome b562
MALPSDLTSQHAKLDANISMMRGRIESVHQDGAAAEEGFDQLKPWTEQISKMLHGYVHEEQRVLLQQATRILGETLEEVSEINDHNTELLERFERFSRTLDDVDDHLVDGALDEVRERFDEFSACFERHRDAERNFYTLYSTILFPAGAATD